MGEQKVLEAAKAAMTKLGWQNKYEGTAKTTLMFRVGSLVLGFVPKNGESGKAEIHCRVIIPKELKTPQELQAIVGRWNALAISDDPGDEWHMASLGFGVQPAGPGKSTVFIRYALGDDESDVLATLGDSESLKGIVDFLAGYADDVRTVSAALEQDEG